VLCKVFVKSGWGHLDSISDCATSIRDVLSVLLSVFLFCKRNSDEASVMCVFCPVFSPIPASAQ
jgi:hypothetical protein